MKTGRDLDMGQDMSTLGWGHRRGLLQPPTACGCVCEQLESFRSEQQASGRQKSCERGFSFPEDGCQGQEWLELGSGMK